MATHSAKSLFDQNIVSAEECATLYDGVSQLKTNLEIDWVLRAAIVFMVSALDTYFHDKIKYRVGKYSLESLPPAMAKFPISVSELVAWDRADRKGNVLRNWVTDHFATRPLQSPNAIAEALKLADIHSLWDTIEPNVADKTKLFDQLNALVKRRNQIAHEGDRETSRRSGKKLRSIDRQEVSEAIVFAKDLVHRIESAFPK